MIALLAQCVIGLSSGIDTHSRFTDLLIEIGRVGASEPSELVDEKKHLVVLWLAARRKVGGVSQQIPPKERRFLFMSDTVHPDIAGIGVLKSPRAIQAACNPPKKACHHQLQASDM